MIHPATLGDVSVQLGESMSTKQRWIAWAGVVYVVLSLSCGVWFLQLVDPTLSNNLFWPFYNSSGFEDFLIDVINAKLWATGSGVVDLMAPDAIIFNKSYGHARGSHLSSTLEYQPTYARRVLYTELNTVRQGIHDLRRTSPRGIATIGMQFCWVDLNRSWAMALTKRRAKRCATSYVDNAAVYMETIVRNTNWNTFVGVFGPEWQIAVASAVELRPGGAAWLAERPSMAKALSVDAEVQYLVSRNLTRFNLLWQNQADVRLDEVVEIESALGFRETLTVKVFSRTSELPWTTAILHANLQNTFMFMKILNASVVRDTPRHLDTVMPWWDLIYGMYGPGGFYYAQRGAFVTTLGPFGSVDAFFVPVPRLMQEIHATFSSTLNAMCVADAGVQHAVQSLPRPVFTPIPPNFNFGHFDYYGGNILCTSGTYTPYPQSQLAIDDTCAAAVQFKMASSSQGLLFAWLCSGATSPADVCSLQGSDDCVGALGAVHAMANLTKSQLAPNQAVLDQSTKVDYPPIMFVQYAQDGDSSAWEMLQQPLIEPSDGNWSFFGWLALFDWIEGRREVVRMDGDVSTLVLMSEAYASYTHEKSNNRPVVQRGTRFLFYLCVGFTGVAVAVGVLVLMATFVSCQTPRNLFVFNRVMSSAWLSRSIVVLRSLTAMVVLSTSPTALVLDHGNSRFQVHHRHWLATTVIVGETMWVSYALHEGLAAINVDAARVAGPLATALAFAATLVIEAVAPIRLRATLNRTCSVDGADAFAHCHSGVISIGQLDRVVLLLGVHVACFVVSFMAFRWVSGVKAGSARHKAPLVLHGAAASHLNASRYESLWHLDDATCFMCGLIPLSFHRRSYILDIKLWTLVQNHCQPTLQKQKTGFRCATTTAKAPDTVTSPHVAFPVHARWHVIFAWLGLVYTVLSALGNVSYLVVSNVNLANDFYWATYNQTAHHAVLGRWFHEQLALGQRVESTRVDEPRWTSLGVNVSGSNTVIMASPHPHVAALHTLAIAIRGLRATDPRLVPWIFTPYCWLDLNRTWEMATTARRQERCASWQANGAVHFETVLRNIPWELWLAAWGEAFAIAFGNDLASSIAGQTWLAATAQTDSSFRTTVDDEVSYWHDHGIDRFDVQWQNFKTVGAINTYAIENALGVQYQRTITHTNGSFRLADQTSFKMYWGLANDLKIVSVNGTGMTGRSLLRGSPRFVFANVSLADVMAEAGTLVYPYYESYWVVESTIGPFGAVDVRIQPCPPSLQAVVAAGLAFVRTVVATNATANAMFTALAPSDRSSLQARPLNFLAKPWLTYGGNLLCGDAPVGSFVRDSLSSLTSRSSMCGTSFQSFTSPAKAVVLIAVLASGLGHAANVSSAIAAACAHLSKVKLQECSDGTLGKAIRFMRFFFPTPNKTMAMLAAAAQSNFAALNVRLMQFARVSRSDSLEILSSSFFDPAEPSFDVWSWMYAAEWALGEREVIHVDGDVGSITIITEWESSVMQLADSEELPTNIARYALRGVQFVTGVLVTISSVAVVYGLTSRGQIEGWNMLELNRVAGLVWVGRPLLLLRGVTALVLLCTGSLELTTFQSATRFTSPELPWYKTLLSAGEATWLVYILNDICMVAMDRYTQNYVASTSLVVWVGAAVVTLTQPVQHSVAVTPACRIDHMDFQLVCDSGVVRIGNFSRFCTLLILVAASNVLCYALVRAFQKHSTPSTPCPSLLLSSPAKLLYERARWMHHGIYFLDPASALLTGIVSIRYNGAIYAVDVKLWRGFVFQVDEALKPSLPRHFACAIPLAE